MPSGMYDAKGRPIQISACRLFFGFNGPRTIRQPKNVIKAVDIGNATAKPVTAPPTPKPATPKPASPKPATSPTVATSTVAAPAADPQKAEPELTWTDMEDATIIGMKALDKSWKEIGIAIPEKHTEDLRARYELFNIQKHNSKEDNQMVSNGAGPKGGENNAEAKEAVAMKQSKEKQRKEKKSRELTEEAKEKKFEEMNAKAQKAKAEAAKWEAEVAKAKSGTIGSKGKARQAKPKDAHGKELKGILKKSGSSRKGLSGLAPTSHQSLPLLFVGDTDGLTADELIILYQLHQDIETNKWVELSSKLFDKTGKRVSPSALKKKLQNS